MKRAKLLIAIVSFALCCASNIPGATISWVGGSGDWNTAANWSTGALPGTNDDVVIDSSGAEITVTHSAGSHTVRSLITRDEFVLSGGSLTVSNAMLVHKGFTISGSGTLKRAALTLINGGRLMPTNGLLSGTLDGVVVNGDIDGRTNNIDLIIRNGLTLNGTAWLGATSNHNHFGELSFEGSNQTLGGNATVVFGRAGGRLFIESSRVLTLGSNIVVRGEQGQIDNRYGAVVNEGSILADTAGFYGIINVYAYRMTNHGVLQADRGTLEVYGLQGSLGNAGTTNGGHLRIDGSFMNGQDRVVVGSTLTFWGNWTNTATITANNATLNLGLAGSWVNAGVINATNSVIDLRGEWANTGTIRAVNCTFHMGGSSREIGNMVLIGSPLNVKGAYTIAQIESIARSSSVLRLEAYGVVTNTGNTLLLDGPGSSWIMNGGTIVGGAITVTNGGRLMPTNGLLSGTLDGVVVNGDIDGRTNNINLIIRNGLTLNGTAWLGGSNHNGRLSFDGSNQTLNGNGTVVFGRGTGELFIESSRVLTLASNIVVRGQNGRIGSTFNFYGGVGVVNQGSILADIANGAIEIYAFRFTNHGNIEVHAAASFLATDSLTFDDQNEFLCQQGATVRMTGSLLGTVADVSRFVPSGTIEFIGTGNFQAPQFLEVMSEDRGAARRGFEANYAYGTIKVQGGTYVRLMDQSDNATGPGAEVLYVNSLTINAGSTLDVNGLIVYTRALQMDGAVVGGQVQLIPDSGPLDISAATSGTIASAGEVDEWTFYGRAGQTFAVRLETGGANVPAVQLTYGQVSVVSPVGSVLASGSNVVAGQTVRLNDVFVGQDGLYRIQVRAAAAQSARTGNYQLTAWEITPDTGALILNQTHHGRIETPHSVDHWTFSGVAGQQVRFELINASGPGGAFTLRGPNGWTGFSNLVQSSGLISLPQSGTYILSAFSAAGQYGIDYAFQLVETVPTEVALGSSFTGQFVGSGQAQLFKIQVPGNQPVQITLRNGGSNNRAELYAGFGQPPSRGDSAYSDSAGGTANRTIVLDQPYPGTWYVLIYGDSISTPGEFSLSVQAADIFLTELSPSQSGNGGVAIVEILGSGFKSTTAATLQGHGISLQAASLTRISSERLVAEFDLSTTPANNYDVVVTQGTTTARLPFQVTGATGAIFKAELIMPSQFQVATPSTMYVEYANVGDMPMVAPLLTVKVDGGRAMFSLDSSLLVRDFWAASQPSAATERPTFFANGKLPGLLRPGESGRVPLHILGLMPSERDVLWALPANSVLIGWRLVEVPAGGPLSIPSLNVQLLKLLPPSTRSIGGGEHIPDQPLNWENLRTSAPAGLTAEAWNAIWMNYTNAAGSSTHSFFRMLEQNVTYLHRLGVLGTTVNKFDELLAFELAQADGLHVLNTLASSTDAYAPAPGLNLVFERTFPNTISTRYRLGPLGRGWSHNWEDRLRTNAVGDIEIVGPHGTVRTFKRDVRVPILPAVVLPGDRPLPVTSWMPDQGDYGQLVSLPGGAFSLREKGGTMREFLPGGKLHFLAEPNGNRITCGYSGELLTSLAHSAGPRLTLAYNGHGRVETITDPAGRVTRFTYDSAGVHLGTCEYYDGRTVRYAYALGQGAQREHAITEVQFPDESHQYFSYNSEGRLESTSRDGGSERVAFTYDTAGTIYAADAYTNTTKFLLGNRGLLVRMENPMGDRVQLQHDASFNLTQVTDPAGRSYDYTYDRRGNLTEMMNALGHRTQFGYEPINQRLKRLIDAKGNPTDYDYDPRGNLRRITYANGKFENGGYDGIGNPITWTNRRRQDIDYQFNSTNGLLTAKLYPDGSRANYEYDSRGNLIAASNYTGRISLEYYPTNDRLRRITYPENRWLEYTYDLAGRRRTMTDHLGYQLQYGYNNLGRLRSITNSENVCLVHYEYDAAGRLALKALGNGVYTTYTYDSASRLEKLTNALPNGSILSFFNYTYDIRGRRTRVVSHAGTWSYSYDDLGQLTNGSLASSDLHNEHEQFGYDYDETGNRVRSIESSVSTEYLVNDLNELAMAGSTRYGFDPDGNLIRKASKTNSVDFVYDVEGHLTGIVGSSNSKQFGYDAFGNRVRESNDGILTHNMIDPIGFGNVVSAQRDSGELVRYHHGFGLLAHSDQTRNVVFYTFDGSGNSADLVNSAPEVSNTYRYTPFGEVRSGTDAFGTRYQFAGEYGIVNEGDGLYFMRHRFYDASAGRFISPDPLSIQGGDVNLYRYCLNNPISLLDPLGLWVLTVQPAGPFTFSAGWDPINKSFIFGSGFNFDPFEASAYAAADSKGIGQFGVGPFDFTTEAPKTSVYGQFTLVTPFGGLVKTHKYEDLELKTDYAFGVGHEASIQVGWLINTRDLGPILRDIEVIWTYSETEAAEILAPLFMSFSRDPNQKVVLTGYGAHSHIEAGSLIPYRIDFENETNAPASARTVIVTDRLTSSLDWETFELTEIAFGDERIMLPPHTQYFETNVPVSFSGTDFVVHVQAGIYPGSGQVHCTLRALNPDTELPPPAGVGFLPPEDGTGRGKGHVSFLIRPKPGLPTGTEIRNVALIEFDQRETIATDQIEPHNPAAGIDPNKQARITIDAGAPMSGVQAMSEESGRAFWVQWSGQDDAGGSGIANYDVYVATNGGPFVLWIEHTTEEAAPFVGELGQSYAFYTIARDNVGNEEARPAIADAQTMIVSDAHRIDLVMDQEAPVATTLMISNLVVSGSADGFLWSLGPGAPRGASINPTNGVLRWTPACSQGSTTNTITVWATDRARTNVSDAVTFTVRVEECVSPQLGRLVLAAGDTGRLPINLVSSVPLTNLVMLVDAPHERLTNVTVEPFALELCTNSIESVSNSVYLVSLTTCSNLSLTGTQQVAWLIMTAISNQPSAFVPVEIGPSIGTQPDGTLVTNYVTQTGTVVVVGKEPLLEALRSTNGLVQLLFYAQPGTTNELQSSSVLPAEQSWHATQQILATNLLQYLEPVATTNRALFFRALSPSRR